MRDHPSCSEPMQGTFWAALSGLVYMLVGVTVKYLPDYSIGDLMLYQFASYAIFALPLSIPVWNANFDLKFLSITFIGVVTAVICNIGRVGALQKLPLGEANAIMFNTPVVTSILARIILKEKITRLTSLSLVISGFGLALTVNLPVILLSQDITTLDRVHFIGVAYAFQALLAISVGTVIYRKLNYVKPVVNMFLQGFIGTFLVALCLSDFRRLHIPKCSWTSPVMISFCVSMFLARVLSFKALQLQESSLVAITTRSSEIFLSFIVQVAVFNDPIGIYNGTGAVLIVVAGLSVPLQHWMQSLPENSPWKYVWWLK